MNIEPVPRETGCPKLPKLTFQTDPSRSLESPIEYSRAASRDHLSFFERLVANPPREASLLDFEHQTLLRRLSIERPLPAETVLEYFSDVGKREDLLAYGLDVERRRAVNLAEGSDETSRAPRFEEDARAFNNRFGFACFSPGTNENWYGQAVESVRPSWMTSVGAGIYFCFNVLEHPDRVFLQEGSVRLLADTMACYGEVGVAPYSRSDERHRLLCAAVRESFHEPMRQRDEIFHASKDFLIRHEIGHSFGCSRSCPITTVIHEATGLWWEAVPVAFPSEHQLGAWTRIKRGESSLDDICFVFGDFFANLVAYQSGLPDASVSLLKAFHWWIVPPASETRMPRGGAIFLKLLYDGNLQGVLHDLQTLFAASKNNPSMVRQMMIEMECASWRWLQSEVLK